ncbi:hypothetical protein SETIT_5G304600v2 [Setaria italica]|uniref:CCHC-type domain-containing protein n=1 Tax=Setaria italica TaxID=4555 RepID=K3XPN6_SETIT|nr:hypothetical protein SETIT_5G304600v2 [Setaria italica]
MANKEFDELALDGHNYPTWASDIEINFASRGIVEAIQEPVDGAPPITDKKKFFALFLLKLYIHKDLKQEYLMERWPLALWKALKEQKYHELLLKNAHQRPQGSAPLLEVHYNVNNNADNKKEFKGNNFSRNSAGKRKFNNRCKFHKRGKGKGKAPPPRGNSRKLCNRCGSNNHVAKECHCPPHLVLLYQKSLKKPKSDKPRYEAHFNLSEATPKVGSSRQAPTEPHKNLTLPQENPVANVGMLTLPEEDPMDGMLIEYFLKDTLGDLE